MLTRQTTQAEPADLREQVLIFAPTGQDAHLIAAALEKDGVHSAIYTDANDLCTRIREASGAVLLSEEALTRESTALLNETLNQQEAWSDIPVIVMTSGGKGSHSSLQILQSFAVIGNVSFLERPLRPITLVSTVKTALRARKRQYQVKELIELQIQATKIRDEFISIASHELKTPLTSLKLQTQMSERLILKDDRGGLSPEKVKKLVDSTNKQVDRLTRLVEDMLDISRINTGKLSIQKSRFDLGELVREVTERFLPQLMHVGCELTVHAHEVVEGDWDRYRIEQVISNLLTNGIRYSPCKPIVITVTQTEKLAKLIVQDQGIGIAPENQERVFQRFERAVSSGNISGLGLGLYICREIAQSHGGNIRVESVLGEGSSFIVELPK